MRLFLLLSTVFLLAAPAQAAERLLFAGARSGASELYSANPDGSDLRRLTVHTAVDRDARWSPDSARVVFVSERSGAGDVYVMNADGTSLARLTAHPARDSTPAWTPDGSIVFTRSGGIWHVRADGTGEARLRGWTGSAGQLDVSRTGRVVFAGKVKSRWSLWTMGLGRGGATRLGALPGPATAVRWSPDTSRVAFVAQGDVHIVGANGRGLRQLTKRRTATGVAWSPDGSRLVVAMQRGGAGTRLVSVAAAGGDERELPALAAPIDDDFADGAIDPELWQVRALGTGAVAAEVDGRLEITLPSDGVPGDLQLARRHWSRRARSSATTTSRLNSSCSSGRRRAAPKSPSWVSPTRARASSGRACRGASSTSRGFPRSAFRPGRATRAAACA